jgi:DNA mismatch repair protein MSH4
MKEVADILETADEHSLIIIDELGRGTSTLDGISISAAVCERLVARKATVFMATHYTGLVDYLGGLFGVKVLRTKTEFEGDRIRNSFRLQSGIVPTVAYGILLAKAVGLPPALIATAESVRSRIDSDFEFSKGMVAKRALQRRKLVMTTAKKIREVQSAATDDETKGNIMAALKEDFITKLNSI